MEENTIDWDKVTAMDNETLLQFANDLYEALHLEQAKSAYQLYLKRNHKNIEALDQYTDCLEQMGLVEELQAALTPYLNQQELITQYEHCYKLLFKYAQTQQGKQAIQIYEYGIQLALQRNASMRDIGDAYAAIAEVYQTDLLQFKESEQACIDAINNAFKYDSLNLDAFLQLANFHLNKEDEEAAKKDLRVIYEKLEIDMEDYDEDFILQVGKLLVEVELFDQSIKILRMLVDRNAEDSESLYMLAFALWKAQKYEESLKIVNGILQLPDAKDDQEIWTATLELKDQLEKETWMDVEDEEQNELQKLQQLE
ncbi:unnamed protein product [Paramecium sonneborni]|uniref:Tetratricopeptide repeat protein n=1 Tax=Paramecium sonneborni TaxID=65129 RepID=A0A8S1L9G6_9CILI|nr:unnamed protein product [Paramecium sonneborni]